MSTPQLKPLTVQSSQFKGGGQINLAGKAVPIPAGGLMSYWALVVNRNDLSIVVNITFDNNTAVPTELSNYGNNTEFFMILATSYLNSMNLPQGDFAKFLYDQGAGTGLKSIEQIYEAFGCGSWGRMQYVYVNVLGDQSNSGYEAFDISEAVVMPLSLNGLEVGGKTLWTPSQIQT